VEPTNTHLLASIRRALSERIAPSLQDADAVKMLGFVSNAVDELLRREQGGITARVAVRDRLHQLIGRGEALLNALSAAVIASAWPKRPDELMPRSEPEASIEAAWERLAAIVSTLVRCNSGDGCRSDALQSFLADVARAEAAGKKVAHAPPVGVSNDESATARRLADLSTYFSMRLSGGAGFAIRELEQLAGGFSNQTFLLTVGESAAATRPLVVRVARANSIQWPYTASLDEEVPVLKMAMACGVPVAPQLWLETDRTVLGAPFHVMEYVPGVLRGSPLKAFGDISDRLIENCADMMAAVHAIPWWEWVGRLPARFVPRAGLSVNDSIDLILERMRGYVEASSISPSPLVLMMLDWLDRNRPAGDGVPSITHGDAGFHNMLFQGDTPVALLDWENVALCGATKDLANVRDCLIPRDRWDVFMRRYLKAGGKPYVESDMRYYEVMRHVQALICTSSAMEKMFIAIDPGNIAFLELGLHAREFFYDTVTAGMADIVSGTRTRSSTA
jgi:aminoglycoside phosphotransferase (APT) family kinase protein